MKSKQFARRLEILEDRMTPTATLLPFTSTGGNSQWELKNTASANPIFGLGQSGFGIADASLVSPLRTDAYDNAFLIAVNGTLYKDANGVVDKTSTTVTTDPSTLSGLGTWVEFFFDPNSATVRALYNFSNSTGSAITAPIQWGNIAGSGGNTKIENTTNGNTTLDVTDRWLITSDNANADPILTWVRFGPGATQTPSSTPFAPGAGSNLYEEEFSLTVPAGQTRRLMFFGQLNSSVSAANTAAATFNDNQAIANAGLLANISSQALDEIVNWNFALSGSLNAASVTDIGAGNNINAATVGKYTFTVTYTDPASINVKSLGNDDIRVTGPNGFDVLATFASSSPSSNAATVVATYNFTPPGGLWNVTDNGNYTFTLQANSVQNVPGLGVPQTTLGMINADLHIPTVVINQAAGQADPTNGSSIDFTVVFSEAVTGFDSSDVVIGGTAGATTAKVTGSGTTYTVSVSGMSKTGSVTASVKASGTTDISSDANSASTSTDNSVQFSTGPQSSLSAANVTDIGAGNNIDGTTVSKYTFTVTYTDANNIEVKTLGNDDIRVTGPNGFDVLATLASASPPSNASSVVATYHFTPPGGLWSVADNGVYTFTLQTNSVQNALGFGVAQKNLGTINADLHTPTVVINQAAGQSDPTNGSPIDFTVVFSEPVTGFDGNDVLIGGSASATTAQVTGSGTTYTVSITGMTQSGTVTANIKAGAAVDVSNDASSASTSTDNSVQFSVGPQSSLTGADVTDIGAGNNIDAVTVAKYTFTVTYTDLDNIDVTTLGDDDVRVTGPNGFDVLATFASSNPATNSASVVATYHFTPPGGLWNVAANGTYTFTLQADSVENALGFGVSQKNLGTVNVEMHTPNVVINQAVGQSDPTNGSPIDFTVVFSEPVTGFDGSDIVIGGTAGATTAQVTGSGTTYTVSITGMAQSGTVTANIKAGAAVDVSNDASTASTSTDNSVQFAGIPQATLTGANVTDIGASNNIDAATVGKYTFTVTYTDPDMVNVKTLGNDDIRVTGPNGFDVLATFASSNPASNSTSVVATYHFTPPGGLWNVVDNGSYTFTAQSNSVQNILGFGIAQKNLGTINADLHVPTVIINQAAGQSDPTTTSPIAFTVVFSEPVTGFEANDVVIGGTAGATTAQVTGSGTTYTVSISGMTQSGTVTAGVKAGAAVDISNDASKVSTSTDNQVDITLSQKVSLYATGADAGGGPHVRVYNTDGSVRFSFFAFVSGFTGGVRVATGDVTGDGIDDIVTGAGPGGGPHVRVFNGSTGALHAEWFAYGSYFKGGIFVAAGDVNGDGKAEVITGADAGGGSHVKVFTPTPLTMIRELFAYPASFTGGVRVASGDVDNDGFDDIITGAGPGGGPHVLAFSGKTGSVLRNLFAYDASFTGGVFVGAGDVDNDGKDDIITGAGTGPAQVKAFSGANGSLLRSFLAFEPRVIGGISIAYGARVAADDINGDGFDDIIASSGPGGTPQVRIFNGQSLANLRSFNAYDPAFNGGVFVG